MQVLGCILLVKVPELSDCFRWVCHRDSSGWYPKGRDCHCVSEERRQWEKDSWQWQRQRCWCWCWCWHGSLRGTHSALGSCTELENIFFYGFSSASLVLVRKKENLFHSTSRLGCNLGQCPALYRKLGPLLRWIIIYFIVGPTVFILNAQEK